MLFNLADFRISQQPLGCFGSSGCLLQRSAGVRVQRRSRGEHWRRWRGRRRRRRRRRTSSVQLWWTWWFWWRPVSSSSSSSSSIFLQLGSFGDCWLGANQNAPLRLIFSNQNLTFCKFFSELKIWHFFVRFFLIHHWKHSSSEKNFEAFSFFSTFVW